MSTTYKKYDQLKQRLKPYIPRALFSRTVELFHLSESLAANLRHGFPARSLKVIGVTGTDGKTTTCFLIHRMLHEAGLKVGLMSTVAYGVKPPFKDQVTHLTTSPAILVAKQIKELQRQGIEWLVLEASSHALDKRQKRLWGIPFSIAVMTNVTHEHLDYHGTFTNYRDAKKRLFELTQRNRRGLRSGVINADDPSAEAFVRAIAHPITYGLKKGTARATDIRLSPDGIDYKVKLTDQSYHIKSHLPGDFNVYNSLAAVCVGHIIGLSRQQVEHGIAAVEGVTGRMTPVDEGQDFSVIVDFAGTPNSFETLFRYLKPRVSGKLIVMFGSPGRRDRTKRAIQGKLAGKYADEVVLTEESDRDEDGWKILEQMAGGAEAAGKRRGQDLFLVHDRAEAIQFAIDRAHSGDTVVMLGKGHEHTIEHPDGEHHWDEIGTARQALRRRLKAS